MFNEYVLHLKFYTVLYVKQILTKKKKNPNKFSVIINLDLFTSLFFVRTYWNAIEIKGEISIITIWKGVHICLFPLGKDMCG